MAGRPRGGGATTTAKATPAPTWPITVDHAEPGTPQSKPNTNTTSSTALTRFDGEQDDERRAVVGGAALDALGAEGEHDERHADGGDPQVRDAEVEHVAAGAEPARRRPARPGTRAGRRPRRRASTATSPARRRRRRRPVGAGAEAAGDPFRRAVGEEVAPRDDEAEHGGGDGQPAELGRAEAADDRRVDEHVQRLDGEAAERRDGQRDDAPVRAVHGLARQQSDGVVGPLQGRRGHGAGLGRADAQQRGQLAGVVEELAVAGLDRRQQLDDGVAGVGLQRPVLGVAAGEVGRATGPWPRRGSPAGC